MRKELEDLWYYYLIEVPVKRSDRENAIIKQWSKQEDYFRSKLNDEQLHILEEYDDATLKVSRISEKNAFFKGVKFATQFIFEALYGE